MHISACYFKLAFEEALLMLKVDPKARRTAPMFGKKVCTVADALFVTVEQSEFRP